MTLTLIHLLFLVAGLSCLSYLVAVGHSPLQWLKRKIFDDERFWYLYCSLCVGFWIGLLGLCFVSVPLSPLEWILLPSMVSVVSGAIEKHMEI